jgi:hypothetical protein
MSVTAVVRLSVLWIDMMARIALVTGCDTGYDLLCVTRHWTCSGRETIGKMRRKRAYVASLVTNQVRS